MECLINNIYIRITVLRESNIEPKCIILNNKELSILDQYVGLATYKAKNKPHYVLGFPVIIDDNIKEFMIGV